MSSPPSTSPSPSTTEISKKGKLVKPALIAKKMIFYPACPPLLPSRYRLKNLPSSRRWTFLPSYFAFLLFLLFSLSSFKKRSELTDLFFVSVISNVAFNWRFLLLFRTKYIYILLWIICIMKFFLHYQSSAKILRNNIFKLITQFIVIIGKRKRWNFFWEFFNLKS